MGIFRSEDIHLCKIAMTKDVCYESMRALGRLGIVSFIDLNKNAQVFELPFSNEMKRCNETFRSIENIENIWNRLQVPLKAPGTLNEYIMAKEGIANELHVSEHRLLDVIEKEAKDYDEFLDKQTKSLKDIKEDYNYLREYRDALLYANEYLLKIPKRERNFEEIKDGSEVGLVKKEETKNNQDSFGNLTGGGLQVRIGHIIGTIATIDLFFRFEILVFRGSRGKVLFNSRDIKKNPNNPKEVSRSSFILTFQDGLNIRKKLEMICDGVRAKLFELPEHNTHTVVEDLGRKILETKNLLRNSNTELRNYLIRLNDLESRRKLGGNSPFYGISTISLYKMHVLIEEEVYRNMNWLKKNDAGNLMYGFIWSKYKTNQILTEMHNKGIFLKEVHLEDEVDHDFETPTYFELNEFTAQFQATVDTYGIPWYKEINPNVFNIHLVNIINFWS